MYISTVTSENDFVECIKTICEPFDWLISAFAICARKTTTVQKGAHFAILLSSEFPARFRIRQLCDSLGSGQIWSMRGIGGNPEVKKKEALLSQGSPLWAQVPAQDCWAVFALFLFVPLALEKCIFLLFKKILGLPHLLAWLLSSLLVWYQPNLCVSSLWLSSYRDFMFSWLDPDW